MRRILLLASVALAIAGAAPALADGPGDSLGYHRHHRAQHGHRWATPRRHHHHRHHHVHRHPGHVVETGVVEYTEAYIGRGLIYNTPPAPVFASSYGHGHVIRARY